MSPLEFAKQECANYDQGRCLGASAPAGHPAIIDNAHTRPLNECVLAHNQRCAYFERCVLPLAEHGNMAFLEARRVYDKTHTLSGAAQTICACGRPRAARARFCAACRIEHRRSTYRQAKKRERLSTVVLSR